MPGNERLKIVFDFAGVLFHWQPAAMLRRILPSHATDDAAAADWVGKLFQGWGGDWADFDRGTIELVPLVRKIAARTGLAEADVRRVVQAIPFELQPDAPTFDLLAQLREAGHELYFLSNMPGAFADHLESTHDLARWFADGVFSARVLAIKPEPAVFDLAARRFAAQPAELVFIDDMPANVLAARACGWRALQYADAEQCARELRALGA